MTDERESGHGDHAEKHGEQQLGLLINKAPHTVTFNEKLGKATRESHLNAPEELPPPDHARSLHDAAGDAAATHAHTAIAPLPTPGSSTRVTVDIDNKTDARILASPGDSPSRHRLLAETDSGRVDYHISIETGDPSATRVGATGADIRPHMEIAANTNRSPTSLLEHDAPQVGSTVHVPLPARAEDVSLQQESGESGHRPGASHAHSTTPASAQNFTPGMPAAVHVIHEPEGTPAQGPLAPPLEGREPFLRERTGAPSGALDAQPPKSAAAAAAQDRFREDSSADDLSAGGIAAPADHPSVAAAASSFKLSISEAAVARLHTEERITLELNKHLDQLAARLANPRH